MGQNFELILPCPSSNVFPGTLDEVLEAFHRRHREFYGYDMAGQPVEVVNLRLVVAAPRPQPPQERPAQGGNVLQALIETRNVWFAESGFVNTPVYRRELLPVGTEFQGPLIVEQMDTTTVVPPKAGFRVDASGALILQLAPQANDAQAEVRWKRA